MKNIKLFVTFVASLFFLFSCEKEKVETCGFDTIRLTESFLTEYAKGDGVDNYMIALASGPTVFDPTNQQWHTENDGWVMLISLFAEPVANLGAPEIPEGKYTLGSAPGAGVWSSEEDVNQLYYTGKDGVSTLVPVSGELTFAKTADGYIMTGKFLAADQKEYCVTYTGTLKFQPQGETSVIDQPVNTKFIGGQAIYKGPDPSFGDLGWVQLELYDAEPDPEMGTILGNFLKIKMFIPIQTEKFTSMPSGTWKLNASADENTAEPGYDSGEDLPTGSYVVQTSSDGSTMKLGMLNQGTITVTEDQHVVIDAYNNYLSLIVNFRFGGRFSGLGKSIRRKRGWIGNFISNIRNRWLCLYASCHWYIALWILPCMEVLQSTFFTRICPGIRLISICPSHTE